MAKDASSNNQTRVRSGAPRDDEMHDRTPPSGRTGQKTEHGVIRDQRGQDQPTDKERALKSGRDAQRAAAQEQPQSPGEPAGGE